MKKLQLSTYVLDSGHFEGSVNRKITAWMKDAIGEYVDVEMRVLNRPEHFQHKYYRGTLLPDIAAASGETDLAKCHITLKRDFLYCPIETGSILEIDERHFSGGTFIITRTQLFNLEALIISCAMISGQIIIVIDDNQKLLAYIPSLSTISFEDMEKFIDDCNKRLFIDLQGHIGMSVESGMDPAQFHDYQKEMKEIYNRGKKKNE